MERCYFDASARVILSGHTNWVAGSRGQTGNLPGSISLEGS